MSPSRRAELVAGLPLPDHGEGDSKHDRGSVVVLGGSPETPGAVVLAGIAALRVGAGRLRLGVDCRDVTAVAVAVPEARVVALDDVASLVEGAEAVLIGPGILDVHSAAPMLDVVTSAATGIVVVDAGALPAAGWHADWLTRLDGRALLTPNPDEAPLVEACADVAVVAVRGPDTVVTAPDGRRLTVPGGGVGLGTSGSGDVAAGVGAGLCARGADPFTAGVWAAALHADAGERLAERVGPIGFLARELLDELPASLCSLSDRPPQGRSI